MTFSDIFSILTSLVIISGVVWIGATIAKIAHDLKEKADALQKTAALIESCVSNTATKAQTTIEVLQLQIKTLEAAASDNKEIAARLAQAVEGRTVLHSTMGDTSPLKVEVINTPLAVVQDQKS